MSDHAKCKWCGKTFQKGGLNTFKSSWSLGLAGKESYCSKKCESEANAGNSNDNVSSVTQSESVQSSGGGVMNRFSNSMEMLNSLDVLNDKRDAKIESIAQIQFGDSVNDISNTLNELVTIASGKPSKEVKKAIYEKMEYAILKLNQLGASAEANFFEKKRAEVKPKWYE